jgi:hypothetical protein
MLPPKFISSDDKEVLQNSGQKYLWQCWEHMSANLTKIDALIINGDTIDGEQYKQRGSELSLNRVEDQSEASVMSLNYLINKVHIPAVYMVSGTPYHDSTAGREAEIVAQRIGARQYPGLGPGRYCRDMLDLNIDGVVLNIQHGVPGTGALYRAVAIDREALWSAIAGKEGKSTKADCVIRSHVHFYVHIEHPTKHGIITPCWQLQTSFMRKGSAYRMIPDIGYVVIEIDGDAKLRGEDPCSVTKRVYPLPVPRVAKL